MIDIACGSAHSACITNAGNLFAWGKGRYGRLGHGDSEDQLKPKMVEALIGYRVIDVACGSGDAQTLCITDDDSVWSFGEFSNNFKLNATLLLFFISILIHSSLLFFIAGDGDYGVGFQSIQNYFVIIFVF